MALVSSEIDTANFFEPLLWSHLGRNRAPLYFNTKRVAETALRARYLFCKKLCLDFSLLMGYFPVPGTVN